MKIAIIGRPNVGKSTLFNRLAGAKLAIVGDVSGITRDRKYAKAELFGLKFDLIDSPGIDTFSKNELATSMNEQSFAAISEADVVLFVIDAIIGITEYDKSIAEWLRFSFKKIGNRSVVLIKNKSEGNIVPYSTENLGFGDGIFISAEHNLGLEDLYSILYDYSKNYKSSDEPEEEHRIKIAIVGRPNVGKSTLINAIIGENRLLTGSEAGITRDAITIDWSFKNRLISIIDTAGQRKKSRITDKIESVAILDAWRYVRQSNIIVVLTDIQNPLEKQDLTIARKAFEEGKIVIFAINKSDTVENPKAIVEELQKRMKKEFAQIPQVACLLVSAKEKLGLARIFNTSLELYDIWSKRISTGALNRWFHSAVAQNPPPLVNGLPIKLKYISQTNSKPPTFVIFANRAEHLPQSYNRYLLNHLRKSFNLNSIPLRLFVRQRTNPHDK